MCGRLVLTSNYREKIKAIFDAVESGGAWPPPRYNITPGQKLPVISQAQPSQLSWISWGFMPPSRGPHSPKPAWLINAKSETIDTLPTFKGSFERNRCIILADGFYEWKRVHGSKPQPYFFSLKSRDLFALAGLTIGNPEDHSSGCVVITTEANSMMHPVHNRMPVLFTPETARTWLGADTAKDILAAILQPFPSSEMAMHPVSLRVNKATNEGPELIDPVRISEQTQLF